MLLIQQSDTAHPIDILMTSSADHITPLTGATLTVTLSKNGAAFAAAAGTVAEIGSGIYKLTPTSADTGTLGELAVHATATGGDPSDLLCQIVAFNPYDLAALGLSRIDAAVSTRATPAQILTTPANLLATDSSGRVTVGSIVNGAIAAATFAANALGAAWDELRANHTTAGSFGQGAASVQGNVVGSVASVTAAVTVGTNNDKTGYALTAGEHTSIATDAQTGLTAQGYTTTRAGYLDTLNGLVVAIWAAATRTLTAIANVTVGGYASGQDPAALVLDGVAGIETGVTVRQAIRQSVRALAAKLNGAGTSTIHIRDLADAKNAITATTDASGNRTAVTNDFT